MLEKQAEAEDKFRSSLNDVVTIAQKLSIVCHSIEELVGICELALANDAQLRLLIATIQQKR